jgi:hypothetical protein
MKVYVFQNKFGLLTTRRHKDLDSADEYIGTLDLDIQKEKKWVTKNEIAVLSKCDYNKCSIKNTIPLTSRNTIITYEVEE